MRTKKWLVILTFLALIPLGNVAFGESVANYISPLKGLLFEQIGSSGLSDFLFGENVNMSNQSTATTGTTKTAAQNTTSPSFLSLSIKSMTVPGLVSNDSNGNLIGGQKLNANDIVTSSLLSGNGISLSGSSLNRLIGSNDLTISLDKNVPTSIVGDSNVKGTIEDGILKLAWDGILPASRGGTGMNSFGQPGQILVVNSTGTGLEYKTLSNGTLTNNNTSYIPGGTVISSILDGAANQTARWDGAHWVGSSALTNDGTNIGVTNNLTVGGTINGAVVNAGLVANWNSALQAGDNISSLANDAGYLTLGALPAETDPLFAGSAASGIVAGDITNWNNALQAGDNVSSLANDAGYLTLATLPAETDPIFGAALDTDGTLTANSDTKVASQKATKTYVDNSITANNALANGLIWVGNAGGVAAPVAMNGQATMDNAGTVTLDNDSVIAKTLTGFAPAAGVTSADSILSAIQTLANNGGHNAATVDATGIANGLSITVPQVMTIATADTTTNGALTFTDWNTFNDKQDALTIGDATTTTTGVNLTGNVGSVIGAGLTIDIQDATALQNGLLTSADWTTFAGKQNALPVGAVTDYLRGDQTLSDFNTDVSANADVVANTAARHDAATVTANGSGLTIDGSQVLTLTKADAVTNGYLDQADWAIFNAKQAALTIGDATTTTTGVNLTGNVGSVIGGGLTIDIQDATTAQNGLLTSADWNTFNSKQDALTIGDVTSGTGAMNVAGGVGSVIGAGVTLTIQNATTAQDGLLTSVDWNTFNDKQDALTIGDATTTTTGVNLTGNVGSVIGAGLTIDIQDATALQNGLLTSADWTTFAGKQNALPVGAVTDYLRGDQTLSDFNTDVSANADVVANTAARHDAATVTANGSGLTIDGSQVLTLTKADAVTNGYLDQADWAIFNAKQAALTIGDATTTTTGVNLTGNVGSVIGGGLTIDIQDATTAQNGLLTSADWNTFNSKQDALTIGDVTSGTGAMNVAGGVGSVIGAGVTLTIQNATTAQDGLLTSVDWNTFNDKQDASLADGLIWVGVAGTPTAVAMNGQATMDNAGAVTLSNGAVIGKTLTGLSLLDSSDVVAGDNIVQALGKVQAQLDSITPYSADGNGIELTGLVFSLELDGTTLTKSAAGLKLSDTYAGQNTITTLGTITSGTWNGTSIDDAHIDNNITASNYLPLAGGTMTGGIDMGANNITTTGLVDGYDVSALGLASHAAATIGTANGLSLVGQALSLGTASGATTGALTSADWTTFNNKQSALTIGNATTPNAAITITGGNGAIIGAGLTVDVRNATTAQSGLLTSADWNTFNGKQNTLTFGDATTTTNGVTIGNGTGSVIGAAGLQINIANASATQNGLLSSADWTTFNNKQNALTFGAGSGLDADMVDGLHAAAFMTTGTDNWVNTTGDTMTGALTLNSNFVLNGDTISDLTGNGLTNSGGALSVSYGATQNSSVRGSTGLTVVTGANSGLTGGTAVTLGTGGTITLGLNLNTANLIINGSGQLDTVQSLSSTATPAFASLTTTNGLTSGISNTASTVINGLTISRSDSDSAGAAGLGTGLAFSLEGSTEGQMIEAGKIATVWSDLTAGSVDSTVKLYGWDNNVYKSLLEVGNGSIKMADAYTSTVGVPNLPLYVDNTGKVGILPSSERYKHDISNMEDIGWLYALRPVNYVYNSDSTGVKQYGLIAEDVEKINSLFVNYNSEGMPETVNYNSFIPVLIKAAQDQNTKIEGLASATDELGLKLTDTTTSLDTALTTIKTQQDQINGLQNQIDNLSNNISNASAPSAPTAPVVTTTSSDEDIINLTTALNALTTQVNTINVDMTALKNAISINAITGNISLNGHIFVDADTASKAVIAKDSTKIEVTFAKPYATTPIVNATPLDFITGQYKISNVTVSRFTIEVSEAQTADVSFNWTALGNN